MSELKLIGKLIKDYGTVEISDKFKKREFVIETEDKYPQKVKFQLTQDKTDFLDQYKQDETLAVHFNVRGNEWKDNFYVNLDAWRLEKIKSESENSAAVQNVQNAGVSKAQNTPNPEDEPLPF